MQQFFLQYSKQIYVLIILLVYLISIWIVSRYVFKDKELKVWFLASFSENGKASGKSLTAFIFAKILAFATIVAVIYSPSHLLPEYYFISILTFVGGLYGIRMASKYFGANESSPKTENNTTPDKSNEAPIDEKKDSKVDDKSKEEKNNPEDLG